MRGVVKHSHRSWTWSDTIADARDPTGFIDAPEMKQERICQVLSGFQFDYNANLT